jgi:hypothetical protein
MFIIQHEDGGVKKLRGDDTTPDGSDSGHPLFRAFLPPISILGKIQSLFCFLVLRMGIAKPAILAEAQFLRSGTFVFGGVVVSALASSTRQSDQDSHYRNPR